MSEAGVATHHFQRNSPDERASECPTDAFGSSLDGRAERSGCAHDRHLGDFLRPRRTVRRVRPPPPPRRQGPRRSSAEFTKTQADPAATRLRASHGSAYRRLYAARPRRRRPVTRPQDPDPGVRPQVSSLTKPATACQLWKKSSSPMRNRAVWLSSSSSSGKTIS